MALDGGFSWWRCLAWVLAIGAHVGLLLPLSVPAVRHEAPALALRELEVPSLLDAATPVDLPLRPRRPAVVAEPRRREPGARARARSRPRPPAPGSAPPSEPAGPVARPLVYLDDGGRALLPSEPLYAATAPAPAGDWHTPGDGSEDDVFYRPRALEPGTTRFAAAWKPPGNVLDDWLGRLVEATSGRASVPLNAKFSLVCGTVAGLAGSCRIVRNSGTGVVVQRPPPAPWERSNRVQCRELRERLAAADDPAEVVFHLDRLAALCSTPAGNEEARREAGLSEADEATGRGPDAGQRVAR